MKRSILITTGLALAACLTLAACEPSANHADKAVAADTDAIAAAVEKSEADMLAAFKAKDAARIASYYGDDAVVSMPGRAALTGREAVSKTIGEDLKDPAFTLDFTNEKTDVAASGDIAYTRGTFRVAYTDPQSKKVENVAGNYVTIFKKQADGSWKVVEDISSPGAPPAA